MYDGMNIQEEILLLITILSISFVGCLCKSYYLLLIKRRHVRFGLVALSTITATFIMYAASDFILSHCSFHTFIGIIFFTGAIGKEIFNQLANLTFVKLILVVRLLLTPNPQDLKVILDKATEKKEEK